jgi:integrase
MWERWMIGFKAEKSKLNPETGKRRTTYNDYVHKMNQVLRYAFNHKMLKHPLKLPAADAVKANTGRVFTDAELQALWAKMGETMRDQFVLSYECFMRLREVLHLTWERIDLETGKLTLRAEDVKTGSRTGKGRTFFVSPAALARLRARWKARKGDSPFVFPSRFSPLKPQDESKTAWKGAKRRAKIEKRARWHDIRHTSLTKALLEHKLNPIEVSEYAGVSIRTIQRVYLHSKEEQTRGVSGVLSIDRIRSDQKV